MIIIVINEVQCVFSLSKHSSGSLHIYFSSAAMAQNGYGNPLSELKLFFLEHSSNSRNSQKSFEAKINS